MLIVLLFTSAPALADTDSVGAIGLPSTDAVAKSKKKGDKDGDKDDKKKKKDDDEDEEMKGKLFGLNWEPYVQPGGGVQIDASGDTAIVAGADVGIRYWKGKLAGDLYLGGSYITSDTVGGYDIHLGDTTGYRAKYFGVAGGVEGRYDGQSNIVTGEDIKKPAFGVGVPVEITVGPKKYYGKAGVMPAWYFDEARKPAAGTVPLGDEFQWSASAGLKLGGFKGEIGFSQLITASGTYNTPILTLGYNP
jgi:hypothetical protein